MVRDKRACGRADFQRAEHRRVHLQEPALIQELAHLIVDARTNHKGIPHFRVHDQIEIALAIAHIGVLQPVPLFRQRMQRLGEQRDLRGFHGDFARMGAEHLARHAQHIANIVVLERGVGFLAHDIALYVNLNLPIAIQKMRKARLAHHAARHHAPRDGHGHALLRKRVESRQDLLGAVSNIVPRELIGVLPRLRERMELIQPDAALLGNLARPIRAVVIRHILPPMLTRSRGPRTTPSSSRGQPACPR